MSRATTDRQVCRSCGWPRSSHPRGCTVRPVVVRALMEYAQDHGPKWKSHLRKAWAGGSHFDGPLGSARALIGPDRLAKIRLPEP